jgi:hypothetical protein
MCAQLGLQQQGVFEASLRFRTALLFSTNEDQPELQAL